MGRINPWLSEKLSKVNSPKVINLIVESEDPAQLSTVKGELARLSGVNIGPSAFNMTRVSTSPKLTHLIAQIPGVFVHYETPMGIRRIGGPTLGGLTLGPPAIVDPLMGKFSLSPITIPYSPQEMAIRFGPTLTLGVATFPFRMASQFLGLKNRLSQIQQPDIIIQTTGDVRGFLQPPEVNKMSKTKVAVLDTGLSLPHPLLHPSKGLIKLGTFAGPVPYDGLGHGQWCVTAAFGDTSQTRFGTCRGIADPENGTLGSWKVLSDIGFGTNFSIIQGIEAAYKWGAKVISMSLGGPLQGSVEDDPTCRIIKNLKDDIIFVIAAGNDGPGEWTIGSPGASPHAVTVGAWSAYYNGMAIFSSRGPNGEWYASHGQKAHVDFSAYGDDMVKPDVVAPGGGPVVEDQPMDLIYSGVVGWTDGMYDLTPLDLFGPMRGTSMSCPQAAGLISLAVDRGMLKTAAHVKMLMSRGAATKSTSSGYGMITWPRLGG